MWVGRYSSCKVFQAQSQPFPLVPVLLFVSSLSFVQDGEVRLGKNISTKQAIRYIYSFFAVSSGVMGGERLGECLGRT